MSAFYPMGLQSGQAAWGKFTWPTPFPSSFPLFLLASLVPLVQKDNIYDSKLNLNCVFLAEFCLHKYVQRISWVYIRYHSVGAPRGHISQVCLLEPAGDVSPASLLEPERVHLWTKASIVGLWDGDLPLRVCVFIKELRASFSLMSTLSMELCL